MMKKLGMLTAFATLFSLTPMQAQTFSCSVSDSQSGDDGDATTATVSDFSCVDTVANSFRTGITIDTEIGSWCGMNTSWYDFSIKVNGSTVAEDLCEGTYDIAEYVEDIQAVNSISIVSESNDSYLSDNVTMVIDAEISYIVTTCPPPSALTVDDIGTTTATFDWTSNGSEVLWDIELVDITAGDTATGVATTSGLLTDLANLIGLTPDNQYEVYVRANCVSGTDPTSVWVGPVAFTTEPTCYPVTNVLSDSVTDVTAFAMWMSGEAAWEIELINTTTGGTFTGNPTESSITDTSFSFTGLTPESDYSFKVRSNCGPVDGNSVWSDAVSFTTLPSCLQPSDIVINNISDTSISISWTSNDDEATWGIEVINVDNGEAADGTSDFTSADTTYLINNLAPNTTYQIFVNAECSSTDQSAWISTASLTTLCQPATIPYIDSLNTWPSDCYTLSNTGTSSNWQNYSGGSGIIEANFWSFSSGTVVFETGQISVSEQASFEFVWSSGLSTFYTDQVIISYSTDGVNWSEVWNKTGAQLASNDGASNTSPGSFITTQILLADSLVGENVVFKFTGNTDWGPDFFLDEIRVLPLPDCNPAYNVSVDSTNQTQAFVSFLDITGDNSLSWDYVATSETDTITGNASATPFTISGLSSGVEYSLAINTLCTVDSAEASVTTFTTECGENSYYTQGFETTPTGGNNIPLCWLAINETTSTSSDVEVTGQGSSSSRSLRLYNGGSSSASSTDVIAITPEFADINDNWLRFDRRTTTSVAGQQFVVGYMTDYTDEDTFVGLDTLDLSTTWTETFFKPVDYPAFTGNRIAIKGLFTGTFRTLLMDNILWEEIPTCFFPDAITVDSTNLTSVYATIDPYLATDAVWHLEIINVTTGEVYTGVSTDTVTTSTFFVDGLDHSTNYELKIRTSCGTDASVWSSYSVPFATACAPVTEFVQGWENGSHCWNLLASSGGNGNATNTIANSTFSSNTGAYYNRLNSSSNSFPQELITVTPELSNLSAGTHWLTLQADRNWNDGNEVEIGTLSDPEDASTFTVLATFPLSNNYIEVHYSFVSYTGTDSYIGIRSKSNTNWDVLLLDDIVWEEAPECATPENLVGVDISDISAEIDWSPISADTAWYVELVDISAGNSPTGIATDSTESHPFTFTGLVQNTQYAVLVKAHCDTNWSDPFTFTTLISHDMEVSNFISPISNACMLTDEEEVVINLTNNGAQDASGFDISYSFDGVSYTNDGSFVGSLEAGQDTAYTLNQLFDFSTADDTTLYVIVSLAVDTINNTNDTSMISITNLGDQLLQLEINPVSFSGEMFWNVQDTAAGNVIASVGSGTYSNGNVVNHDVCVKVGTTYKMEAWDTFGDGWNGGTYEFTQCGGVLVANNGGLSPTNGVSGSNALEAFEYFTIEECDDYDLGIISLDSISSSCGMTATEQGYLLVQNFGLMDITPSMNVTVQYQVNGAGWSTLATFTDFASGADSLIAMPTTDMSTPLTYNFEFLVSYGLDENSDNDTLSMDIESVDTYTEISSPQDFEDAKSGWTVVLEAGPIPSWEWGTPTTPQISATSDGKAWVTRLHENMFLNEESYLLSPCFDFSSYTNDAEISFDFIWTSTSSNTVRFQVSTDGGATWPSSFGSGWNSITMPANTTEWTNRIELMDLAGEGDVKFRFFMDNSWSVEAEGFGMDNWSVIEHIPYTDTTLSVLFVEGDTIDGFDPTIFDYDYVYPYGDTTVSNYTISAIVNAPFYESMVITQPTSLPGTGTVVVTAEDTNFSGTYTINFIEGDASTNAYLSDLTSVGPTVDGFDSLIYVYYDTVPFGTSYPIPVTYELADPTADAVQVDATALTGVTTVTVVAQDGTTSLVYSINYFVIPADDVSTLDSINTTTGNIAGFHSDTLEYDIYSSVNVPLTGYATSALATVSYNPVAVSYAPGSTVEITVTAQDGSTTVYIVNIIEPLSDNNDLASLTVDGSPVSGFHPDTLEYTETVAFGTDLSTVVVDYTTDDPNASASDILSGNTPPATTTIVVTAEDGSTKTYIINWEYEPASSNCLLADISLNYGVLLNGFDPNTFNYVTWFDDAAASIFSVGTFEITALAQDPNATVSISPVTGLGTTVVITVIAEDGVTECVYYIDLVDGTGTTELEAGSVSIYPNPSHGQVNVSVTELISDYSVDVYTPNGQKVFTNEYTNDNSTVQLDLSAYADGIYYVMVTDSKSGKSIREKITILK